MSKEMLKTRLPMNIQFFAEPADEPKDNQNPADEPKDNQNPADEPKDNQNPADDQKEKEKEPTVQELMVELAKVKRAQEKAASEAAEYKKKYNAKLSEKEKIDAEKAEREAEKEQKFQELLRENRINKLEKSYLAINFTPEEASKMAVAEVDGDEDAKIKIMRIVDERKKKEYEAEFIKTRPHANVGTDGEYSVTKEQFEKMGYQKRVELRQKNPELYKKFTE